MELKSAFFRGPLCLALLLASLSLHAVAQSTFSGDVNGDGIFDVTDIVELLNTLDDPNFDNIFGIDLLILDADQDGSINSGDATRIAAIIVGLENPIPLSGRGFDSNLQVSLWLEPTAHAATEINAPLRAPVSLWLISEPPTATEINVEPTGPPSLWLGPEVPAATEVDAVQQGTPSFELES